MSQDELSPQFDPSQIEVPLYREWESRGLFKPDARKDAEPFVVVIPPPNVTDILHMGHGLNNTVQDVAVRFERMRGRATLWVPGTDHAGIATQNVVERLLQKEGKTRFDLGREAFVKRVEQYVAEKGTTILEQLKAIGASCGARDVRAPVGRSPDLPRPPRGALVLALPDVAFR
jgi:valyl-tRNA synthetase